MSVTLSPPRTQVVLMDRSNNGTLVELIWNGGTSLSIRVTEPGENPITAAIPSSQGLDAFDHPYVYLA